MLLAYEFLNLSVSAETITSRKPKLEVSVCNME